MSSIDELDPDILLKLLEGVPDVIGPQIQERDRDYAEKLCPRCSGPCKKIGGAFEAFATEFPPRFNLLCIGCGCEFSPDSGLIVKLGNLAEVYETDVSLVRMPNDSG